MTTGSTQTSLLLLFALPLITANCCWGDSCTSCNNDVTSWCNLAQSNCEGSCNGHWCGDGPQPTPVPGECGLPGGMDPNPSDVNATGFAREHGKLRLDGIQLVDSAGQAIQLTGMSSHGLQWLPKCYTKASLEHIVTTWGVTVMRAAMYVGEGGYATDRSLADLVDDMVDMCEELGIYIIIDFHVLTPGDPNAYLDGRGASTGLAIDFWKRMALSHGHKSHVLYEIANEPNGVDWETVRDYHNAVIAAIRSIDTETIIICGTPTWSQDIHLAAEHPVDNKHNVMYTFHLYAGTHMGLLPRLVQYATVIPVFVTEWGTIGSQPGQIFLDNSLTFLNALSSTGVLLSHAQWTYSDADEACSALVPGACAAQDWDKTQCSGTFIRSFLKTHSMARSMTKTSGSSQPILSQGVVGGLVVSAGALVLLGVAGMRRRSKRAVPLVARETLLSP